MECEMIPPSQIIMRAKEILKSEQQTLECMSNSLDINIYIAIEILLNTKGCVIITGIGKSGLIGQKIAATIRSTGTKSYFMHSSEAMHGDLGLINSNDTVLALSNSGKTLEVIAMIPYIRKLGAKLITFTSDKNSPLSKQSDVTVSTCVQQEACGFNLIPTCSTTAMLALGDCVALILSELKQLSHEEFALYHPGGNIGNTLNSKRVA